MCQLGFAAYITLELMTDNPEKRSPVAIKIEGVRNIRLDNNVAVGMPLLDAKDVENLSGSGNMTFQLAGSDPTFKKAWYERAAVKAVISVLVAVAAAGVIYVLGWN